MYETFLAWSRETRRRKIQKWHHYFDIYERHLARFRGTECRLLEIGVMDGGSLQLWSEYLGPKAEIIGAEIDPRARMFDRMLPNIRVVTADQSDPKALAALRRDHGPFDIVIDDGGHTARQQINTFNGLYPAVDDHGVFICEDTHTSYWPSFQDAGERTMIRHAKAMIDEMHSIYLPDSRRGARFTKPMSARSDELVVSRFAASTFSIQFYDSMIVFEKRPRSEPWSEFR